eukprot:CAMPEP_0181377650 /NCGR_PEP_ID=MMETSP1106-20121128/18012_1 /TAXON_ID=81844 /ORGANISM="Mantoniella antarctica, Strain SL-175" /LENGTH=53 /DNA_ID=CAMNT_0023496403 /DNA_START=119 /DNA_END=280 /DNA_ORIENTATION=+
MVRYRDYRVPGGILQKALRRVRKPLRLSVRGVAGGRARDPDEDVGVHWRPRPV